jgi:hypothetical protein
MTFEEFHEKVGSEEVPYHWRVGQFIFNRLHSVRPDLARLVQSFGVAYDPYYNDLVLPKFWEFIQRNWDFQLCGKSDKIDL